jgi:hypothetical protein
MPGGVDRVLLRAAEDPAFREALRSERSRAAADAGFALVDSERSVLDAATPDQLDKMIEALSAPERRVSRGIRPLVPIAAAAAGAVILGGAAAGMLLVTGSRPDEPRVHAVEPADAGDDGDGGDAGEGG